VGRIGTIQIIVSRGKRLRGWRLGCWGLLFARNFLLGLNRLIKYRKKFKYKKKLSIKKKRIITNEYLLN
jgi:hypothetical protein